MTDYMAHRTDVKFAPLAELIVGMAQHDDARSNVLQLRRDSFRQQLEVYKAAGTLPEHKDLILAFIKEEAITRMDEIKLNEILYDVLGDETS